jgi:hypothetical protein
MDDVPNGASMNLGPTWNLRYLIASLYGPAINTSQWEVPVGCLSDLSNMKAEVERQVGKGGFTSGAIHIFTPGEPPTLIQNYSADLAWEAHNGSEA